DGSYPGSEQVLADTGAKLIRGDGNITHVSCNDPHQIKVWARDLKLPDERMCFAAPRGTGFLTVSIPGAYRIQTYERSVKADISVKDQTQSLDVASNTSKGFGEAGTDPSAAVLLEMRVTGSSSPTPQGPTEGNPLSFTGKLNIGDTRSCTATLVAPLWVVTAKSCFADDPAKSNTVAAGAPKNKTVLTVGRSDLTTNGGHTRDIVELVPHADRDLVLARLAVPASNITPVALSATAPAPGQELTLAGFGRTLTEWVPSKLHSATYTVGATNAGGFDVAAKSPADASLCKGDAGAPALRTSNGTLALAAIASRSWQDNCLGGTGTKTGAYTTRVDDLAGWIGAHTSNTFNIVNPTSGRCLNLAGAGPWENGTRVILWDCTLGAPTEQFKITAEGQIVNPTSGRCLNLEGAGPWTNGTRVLLWDCHGAPNEKFEWTPDGQLRNPTSGRCLNLEGGSGWTNNTRVLLWDCSGGPNEKFKLTPESQVPNPVGMLLNPTSGRCLNLAGAGPWENGTRVILWDCTLGAPTELFKITAEGQIVNPTSGRCLNLEGASGWTNGTRVLLWDCSGGPNEKFEWTPDGQLRNPTSGRCLNLEGGSGWTNNTRVLLWDCSGGPNEKFKLTPESQVPNPVGMLLNPTSGRCLNLAGAGPWENGTRVILWDCTLGAPTELFKITAEGQIVNPTSGRCLNLEGAGPWTNGTRVLLWDCHGAPNEKFEWTPDGQLRNPTSGRCLNLEGGSGWTNNTRVLLWDCSGGPNEKFKLTA
ncbi:RICIN domain-containing protein, partial [Streptomyces nojiriensis]|uniref:RICIN domain-containing protein n=1 Tax=Streptomyces nojiriensis TaxID=66374 RepID=UPI00366093C7